MSDKKDRPVANPLAVLREEFDDWAVLFDPDTGNACGLNPVGVFIWKRLDGHRTVMDIVKELQQSFEDVSDRAETQCQEFIQNLVNQGFAGYEVAE